jgi:sensor histidine kinase YesM
MLFMDSFFSTLVLSDRRGYRFARHFLFWFVCWLFQAVLYGIYYPPDYRFLSYAESFFFLPQHIFLSYSIIYFVLPVLILKERYWTGLVAVIALIITTALFSPMSNIIFIEPFRAWIKYPQKNLSVFYSFMGGLRGSMTVAGFAVAIKLIKHWYHKKIENEQLEKEKLRSELQVLKGQVHPHFMFNTLNSIYALSLKKPEDTSQAILKLSDLMRYILTESTKQSIELKKEIETLQHYIELEKSRFEHRLDMTINIKGDINGQLIAPLLLLPFIENSFKHGANEMVDQVWISLDLLVEGDVLKFKLINGRNNESGDNPNSAHVGLQNVKRRLNLLYPNAHELRITEDTDTFVVALTLFLKGIRTVEV